MRSRAGVLLGLLALFLICSSCTAGGQFDQRLNSITNPYRFSSLDWEKSAISYKLDQFPVNTDTGDLSLAVLEYFSISRKIDTLRSEIAYVNAGLKSGNLNDLEDELAWQETVRKALEGTTEKVLERQIKVVLDEQGIHNPGINWQIDFPPVLFKLTSPPDLLVVSPRDKIEPLREILLEPRLRLKDKESIENQSDGLNVSSLVLEIGGYGATYPALVTNDGDLQFTINTAAEEWVHQYLAFKPLGFLYILDGLGISPNYDIATMNETVAGMVSEEIGSIVYQKYYSRYEKPQPPSPEPEFDFNKAMREIRKQVDAYLAEGKVEEAEQYLETERQYLATKGYYIRKLNQAYFAFNGTYAENPTSISPIGSEMKALREKSPSLAKFLDMTSGLTSIQALNNSIK